jgi:hypothetical protein
MHAPIVHEEEKGVCKRINRVGGGGGEGERRRKGRGEAVGGCELSRVCRGDPGKGVHEPSQTVV